MSGGKIELTELGEELYRRGELKVGSLLRVAGESSDFVILTTNAYESNALFEENSVYLALRKRGLVKKELENVELSQILMSFSIIGEIDSNSAISKIEYPQRPPSPGSPVYQLVEEDRDKLFGGYVEQLEGKENYDAIKDAYKFGGVIGSKGLDGLILRPYINMHLGIIGTTGSGKSFTTGAIIEKLGLYSYARRHELEDESTLSLFVFDVHGEYKEYYSKGDRTLENTPYGDLSRGDIREDIVVLSISGDGPLIGIDFVYEDYYGLRELYSPSELTDIVLHIYGTTSAGVYKSLLTELFKLEPEGEEPNIEKDTCSALEILHRYANGEIDERNVEIGLSECVENIASYIGSATPTVRAAKNALNMFFHKIKDVLRTSKKNSNVYGPEKLRELATSNSLVILDLSGTGAKDVDLVVKDLVISFVLRTLYVSLAEEFFNTKNRVVFVIDEAQNFIPARGYGTGAALTKSITRKIASQGRKFGFSLILISQRPSFMDPHTFSLVNSLIVHRTAMGDAEAITKLFGLPRHLSTVFTNQRTGEAFVFGQLFGGNSMRIKIRKGIDRKIFERIPLGRFFLSSLP